MQFVVIMWEKKGKKFCKTGDQDFSIYWKVTLVKLVKEYNFLLLSIQFMKIYPTMILQLDNPLIPTV